MPASLAIRAQSLIVHRNFYPSRVEVTTCKMEAPTIFVVRPGDIICLPQPILLKTAPVATIEPNSPASLARQHCIGMAKPTSASESSDPASSNCSLPIQLTSTDLW